MPLALPGSRAFRSTIELRSLVTAVRDASGGEMEQDWIEWKAAAKVGDKSAACDISRYIIGVANRHPDQAAAIAEGCAYLLIGVAPANLDGTSRIDVAQLDQSLEPYLGADVPRWHSSQVEVDGTNVLVITIEAPQWGDPIHHLRKEYGSYESGAVFIRKAGRTVRPDGATWMMLQERLLRRGTRVNLSVAWASEPPDAVPALDTTFETIRGWLEAERLRLLAPLADAQYRLVGYPKQLVGNYGTIITHEQRTVEQYRAEVDEYLRQAKEQIPARARAIAVEEIAPSAELQVVNETDSNFADVQVEVMLPGPISGYLAISDAWEGVDFPTSPALYRTARLLQHPSMGALPFISSHRVPPRAWIDNDAAGCRILFAAIDVRPRQAVQLPSFRLLARAEGAGMRIPGKWKVTAKNADGVVEGSIDVYIDRTVVSAETVLEEEQNAEPDE